MIIVLGKVTVSQEALAEALDISRAHVARSRAEPGCISHAVYPDPEHPGRLAFVEQWADPAALAQHFQVPASREFFSAISALAVEPPDLSIYAAEALESPL